MNRSKLGTECDRRKLGRAHVVRGCRPCSDRIGDRASGEVAAAARVDLNVVLVKQIGYVELDAWLLEKARICKTVTQRRVHDSA